MHDNRFSKVFPSKSKEIKARTLDEISRRVKLGNPSNAVLKSNPSMWFVERSSIGTLLGIFDVLYIEIGLTFCI